MEQTITLSSQVARAGNSNNTSSDFTTVLDRSVTLDRNKRAFIGLKEINTMAYSWYNVNKEYNNDIIRYRNCTEYKIIAFISECYSYSELSTCYMETDGDSPIKIEFVLTSFRY